MHSISATRVREEILILNPELSQLNITNETMFNEIGVDSLMLVGLILTFSEENDIDLEIAFEGIEPPRNIHEFIKIFERFNNE